MPDIARLQQSLEAYAAEGAEVSQEKGVDFAENFTAWGTEIQGRTGRVGVSDEKRRQMFRLIVAVLLSGFVSKPMPQSLLGSIVYPLMRRRELMCCLTESFVFVEHMHVSNATKIPPRVQDELLVAALFMTLAFTDIRAPVATLLGATDATVKRAGACQA